MVGMITMHVTTSLALDVPTVHSIKPWLRCSRTTFCFEDGKKNNQFSNTVAVNPERLRMEAANCIKPRTWRR